MSVWSTPLGIAGIVFIVVGLIMAIVGIVLLVLDKDVEKPWYIWVLLAGGIVLGIIGGIMLAVAYAREEPKLVSSSYCVLPPQQQSCELQNFARCQQKTPPCDQRCPVSNPQMMMTVQPQVAVPLPVQPQVAVPLPVQPQVAVPVQVQPQVAVPVQPQVPMQTQVSLPVNAQSNVTWQNPASTTMWRPNTVPGNATVSAGTLDTSYIEMDPQNITSVSPQKTTRVVFPDGSTGTYHHDQIYTTTKIPAVRAKADLVNPYGVEYLDPSQLMS